MSTSKKNLSLNSVSINLGCGTCKRPKLGFIFNPKSKHNNKKHHFHNNSSSTLWKEKDKEIIIETSTSTTKTSFFYEKSMTGFGRDGNKGVAVEKDSDDPYLDFRHSMLQMILENEIYSKDDLRELLKCFLQLNSKEHHGTIIRVFTEIWNAVFSINSGFQHGFHLKPKF